MDKKIEKNIDNLMEQRKIFWTALIVLIGGIGTIIMSFQSLQFNPQNIVRTILLVISFYFLYLLSYGIMNINKKLNKYLR